MRASGLRWPNVRRALCNWLPEESVALGRDNDEGPLGSRQEVDELLIALLRSDVRIDQHNAKREYRALAQVGINETRPLAGNFPRDPGVSVTRQVGENQFRPRLARDPQFEEVDGARAPRRELVRAIFVPTRVLITLDLPTLDRPRKAISGSVGAGEVPNIGGREQKSGKNTRIFSFRVPAGTCK